VDEKSKQLLKHSHAPLPIRHGMPLRENYEYLREGTCNLFVAIEPHAGRRTVQVTARCTKHDFHGFLPAFDGKCVSHSASGSSGVGQSHPPLSMRARGNTRQTLGHVTSAPRPVPKHASWLDMAEIEIAVLGRQCLDRRLPDEATMICEVNAWQKHRNKQRGTIDWSFTRQDAGRKMAKHYVSSLTC